MGLQISNLCKDYAIPVLRKLDLQVTAGEIHGVVGENGAGKSTLLKILSGFAPKTADELNTPLDADAIRLLHRSVAYYLERWPGGPDPREQQDLQSLQRLLYAALLECSFHEDGQS